MSSASRSEQYHETEASEWTFEPSDNSVGYTGGWVHEECPVDEGTSYGVVTENRINGGTRTVTCQACGGMLDLGDDQ